MDNNTLPAGTVLQGTSQAYRIEKVLGQGSFGITYLATTKVKVTGPLGEIETAIQVAVKEFFMREINGREGSTVTSSGSQGGVYDKYKEKFAREARNLSRLKHPHIVKVLESFEANNTVYYAMEYLEGGSLDSLIAQHGGLSEAECMKYLRQVGSALAYMHANKMLHLDLKPGNIMLRQNGDAVLIDFGLSKQYDADGEPETSTTVGGGTPGYAPIEQANYHEGKGFPVTMDVYALGATGYKMLTGVRPPEASDILNTGLPVDKLRKHGASREMAACIERAMSVRVKDRPQSVDGFLKSLPGGGGNEEEVTVVTDDEQTTIKSRIVLDGNVQKLYFLYSEPSHPASRSFDMEVTPSSLKVKSFRMGDPVKSLSLHFTPEKFKALCQSVNMLRLYKTPPIDEKGSTGGYRIGLRINNGQNMWHYGSKDSQYGTLTGDVYDLLELMKRQIPAAEYQALWLKPTVEKRNVPGKKTWWERNKMFALVPGCGLLLVLLFWLGNGAFDRRGYDAGQTLDATEAVEAVDDAYLMMDTVAADIVEVVDSVAVVDEPMDEAPQEISVERKKSENSLQIYDEVDYDPEFPGGMEQLNEFLYRHLDYPADAMEMGVQGRVLVSFIVEKDGSLSGIQVLKKVDPSLDKEAVRVVRSMPKWTPGRTKDGRTVRVKYTLPITFRLS